VRCDIAPVTVAGGDAGSRRMAGQEGYVCLRGTWKLPLTQRELRCRGEDELELAVGWRHGAR